MEKETKHKVLLEKQGPEKSFLENAILNRN